MQSTGQTSTQAVSLVPTQGSQMIYAIPSILLAGPAGGRGRPRTIDRRPPGGWRPAPRAARRAHGTIAAAYGRLHARHRTLIARSQLLSRDAAHPVRGRKARTIIRL